MKRIILLGLIGFVLSGCGDDKVTNEYLVGKWDCKNERYESNYDPKFKEYDDYSLKSSGQFKYTYKIINSILMVNLPSDDVVEADLDKIYKNPTIKGKQGDCEYITNRSLIKKSSNKFASEMETFFTCSNEKGDVTKTKIKRERVCTRIE